MSSGAFENKARQVIDVQALHDDDDLTNDFVVETAQQGAGKPLVDSSSLRLGAGVLRLDRVVDDDEVPAATGDRASVLTRPVCSRAP